MENSFFHDLYKTIRDVRARDCCAKSLSHLLQGYLSVYSMVRVCPDLECKYGNLQEIHERVREIAGELTKVVRNDAVELDERMGYVSDLMDAYQIYSDMDLLDEALDIACRILFSNGRHEIILPGRTPNVGRLLCNWMFFVKDEEDQKIIEVVFKDVIAGECNVNRENVFKWWKVFRSCEDIEDDRCLANKQGCLRQIKMIQQDDVSFLKEKFSLYVLFEMLGFISEITLSGGNK